MRHIALEWALPVFLTCMLTCLGRDDELPETEDYLWEALTFYTMGIPIVRDVATMAKDNLSSAPRMGSRSPLIYSGIENLYKGAKHAYKAWDENDANAEYKAAKELTNAFGYAMGYGTPQIFRTWEGTEAMLEGEGGVLAPLLGKPMRKDR